MALVKDRMGSVQTCAYNGNLMGDLSSLGQPYHGFDHEEDGDHSSGLMMIKNLGMSHSPPSLGSPSSTNSGDQLVFHHQATNNDDQAHDHEAHSLINFRGMIGLDHLIHANGSSSLLSFEQNEKVAPQGWDQAGDLSYNNNHQWNQMNAKCNSASPRLMEDFNAFQTASNFTSMASTADKESHGDWLYTESTIVADSIRESATPDATFNKRPNMGQSSQALKKHCISSSASCKKPKPKAAGASKDPQSIAAKNRRERISERLKTLQELVPNGSKVDLVTMLEKAISYVKFLQLQVKVLATDEFWPVQGGKAPDISQVKEAIDAILSSQRNSSSNSK